MAVHPDDPRYSHLVGTEVELPLSGRRIPVVADPHVDPEFGTGAVKVTPAHDPDDFEIGRRHDLPSLTVMDERGVITAHGPFQGLDRFEARPAVLAALREQGRVVAERRPYLHAVGHCQRCGTTVEPRLSLQWFVKVGPLAKAAGDAVRDGRVRIHPPQMAARYFDWVDDMHDWCISRQLWWGHRIPVWYSPDGDRVRVGPDEEPPAGRGLAAGPRRAGHLVLLRAVAVLHARLARRHPRPAHFLSDERAGHRLRHPVLLGGPDDDVRPLRDDGRPTTCRSATVALHGLVRDQYGKKMSKSRGNTVDPLDWIDRFGADATRFTLARGSSPGSDVAVSEEWAAGARNFCNKLWNAARFALLNGADAAAELPAPSRAGLADRWILSRLAAVTAEADELFEHYEFGKACDALYHFAWDEFCDWYLELAKVPLNGGDPAAAAATRAVLGHVLDRCCGWSTR